MIDVHSLDLFLQVLWELYPKVRRGVRRIPDFWTFFPFTVFFVI